MKVFTYEAMIVFGTVFAVSYIWHAMGVTIGYHRLLTHRSFNCPKVVEYFWLLTLSKLKLVWKTGGILCLWSKLL